MDFRGCSQAAPEVQYVGFRHMPFASQRRTTSVRAACLISPKLTTHYSECSRRPRAPKVAIKMIRRPTKNLVVTVLLLWQLAIGAVVPSTAMASTPMSAGTALVAMHCHGAMPTTDMSGTADSAAHSQQDSHSCQTICCASGCLSSCGAVPTAAIDSQLMAGHVVTDEPRCPARVQRLVEHFRPPI